MDDCCKGLTCFLLQYLVLLCVFGFFGIQLQKQFLFAETLYQIFPSLHNFIDFFALLCPFDLGLCDLQANVANIDNDLVELGPILLQLSLLSLLLQLQVLDIDGAVLEFLCE